MIDFKRIIKQFCSKSGLKLEPDKVFTNHHNPTTGSILLLKKPCSNPPEDFHLNLEFNDNYYIQLHGTAVGICMAPAHVNLFMGDLEKRLLAQSPIKPFIWWRYIDDIFMIWTHQEDKLKEFITHLNSSRNTIKFTHKFSDSSISSFDVIISLAESNQISTDLFVMSTDIHQSSFILPATQIMFKSPYLSALH